MGGTGGMGGGSTGRAGDRAGLESHGTPDRRPGAEARVAQQATPAPGASHDDQSGQSGQSGQPGQPGQPGRAPASRAPDENPNEPHPRGSFSVPSGEIAINGVILEEGILVPVLDIRQVGGQEQTRAVRLAVRVSAPVGHVRWEAGDRVVVVVRYHGAVATFTTQVESVSEARGTKRTTFLSVSGNAADHAARALHLLD